MKVRFVKATNDFGSESWFCQREESGVWRFVDGSVALSEAEGKAKYDSLRANAGSSLHEVEIIHEHEVK
jgi:hypothetical protein